MKRMLLGAILLLQGFVAVAQKQEFFHNINSGFVATLGKPDIHTSHSRVIKINMKQLLVQLSNAPLHDTFNGKSPVVITLPLPDGSQHEYQVVENNTMHPVLAAKFPDTKTYDAYGITDPNEFVKLDTTIQGFHAMIMSPGKNPIYIDPYKKQNTQYYIVYNQNDFHTDKKMKCGVTNNTLRIRPIYQLNQFANFNTCVSREYRLAMAATSAYTNFHGGKQAAVDAQVTTMNRVNGIYETNLAIHLQLIANNDILICETQACPQLPRPYTSGEPPLEIDENQININAVIGAANYDIGHVVDAAGSGLAQLGSVCHHNEKAMGVTGTGVPRGDPFDVDYVAHEIGHQFSANHIQNNSCQRNPPTAVEPGSGSTIMGYAKVCDPSVQDHSDPYFNGINLAEIGEFISGSDHNCPITAPISPAPIITPNTEVLVIPANTPFALTANAKTTAPNATLTYTWEQMDNEESPQPPQSSSYGGPNFRSLPPTVSPTRFLPSLAALANKGPFTWEVLPSVSRTMKFRTSVRNNVPNLPPYACNAYSDISIRTEASAGPFVVTYPDHPNINWIGGSGINIKWNPANTNFGPVHALFVDIFMSIDGGLTFPYAILSGVKNNGVREICVPNFPTSNARIMVRSANGSFFNVSTVDTLITPTPPKAPILIRADRNPLRNTEAYVDYGECIPLSNDTYTVNGLSNVTIRLDNKNKRFIIGNILTPKKVTISITATDNNSKRTSNAILIPSIL